MKKVLIALANDGIAQQVAETGYELAKAMNAKVILLHVTSAPSYSPSLHYSPIIGFDNLSNPEVVEKDAGVELRKEALHLLKELAGRLGDEKIQVIVEDGDFAETILLVASELRVDMIVVGTHNRKGLGKMILGSVAENVLHGTDVPILIIPSRTG